MGVLAVDRRLGGRREPPHWGGAVSRIPTRLRLTLLFAIGALMVLSLAGVFVYERFRSQVDTTIDINVKTQASALLSLISNTDAGLSQIVANPLVRGHQNFVQILNSRGEIVAATPGLKREPLLSGDALLMALGDRQFITHHKSAALPQGARLLATPVRTQEHGRVVMIVGTPLDQQSSSLSNLGLVLAIVGPLAVIAISFAAYRVASAALAPVELMRKRAAAVSAAQMGVRLPLPPADDEIRRLGVTLNEMLERLERSFAHERRFVADASHELRTPLATLKAELELGLRRERSPEELRDTLRSAQEEVDRLSSLADDLLVLARADEGRLPIREDVLDVLELLERTQHRAELTGGTVTIDVPDGLQVVADPQRLEQALDNLIDNALRYGSPEVLLEARSGQDGGVELHVKDRGPGFPAGFLPRAFERFSRADYGRTVPGSGLGLAIVRVIARTHGGEAYAANRQAGGADVWIVIPSSKDV